MHFVFKRFEGHYEPSSRGLIGVDFSQESYVGSLRHKSQGRTECRQAANAPNAASECLSTSDDRNRGVRVVGFYGPRPEIIDRPDRRCSETRVNATERCRSQGQFGGRARLRLRVAATANGREQPGL